MTIPRVSSTMLIALCVAISACQPPEPEPPRVLVLGIDGLDAEVVDQLTAEGLMPNFERMRRDGAHGVLWADPPLLSPILWTTIATGRTPDEHGIGSFAVEASADGSKKPVTSTMRRVDSVWNIASAAGRTVGVVGWWATWPPESVNGVIVSDHTCYHLLFGEGQRGAARTEGAISPPQRAAELEKLIRRPDDVTFDEASRYITVAESEFDRPFDFGDDISHLRWALATADSYRRIGSRIWTEDQPELLMVYIEGTDSLSHLFGHLFRAEALAGDLADQQHRYGRAVEEIYKWADELVGEFMAAMDERTTLVVLSDHGFKLGELHQDPSVTTSMRRVSDAFHDPDGVLYMIGRNVRAGARIEGARHLDVTPTLLELLGIPASHEMGGRVLLEAFETGESLPRVPSYDTGTPTGREVSVDRAVDREVIAHLEALGYLEPTGGETAPIRSRADMLLRGGRYDEAAAAFAELIESDPSNAALHLNLGVALSNLDRDDDALSALDRALELDPTNPKVVYNQGLILERRGELDVATELYRSALRYDGSHEGARRALERITGSARVYVPRNERERRASELAALAAENARRGDYEAAGRILDEAEELAPDHPMIHQYRANVAYLTGDLDGAIAALERALELEPGNAQVEKNLESLRRRRDHGAD